MPECRSHPLGGVHGQASLPAIRRLRIQTVLGVHDQRHTQHTAEDAPQNAGLRVVGVDDVGANLTDQLRELHEGAQVLT